MRGLRASLVALALVLCSAVGLSSLAFPAHAWAEPSASSESHQTAQGDLDTPTIVFSSASQTQPPAERLISSVEAQSFQPSIGWRAPVSDGSSTGGEGFGLGLTQLKLTLNSVDGTGNLLFQLRDSTGTWTAPTASGIICEVKQGPATGLRAWLDGDIADRFELWYQVHVSDFGWLAWTQGIASEAGITGVDGPDGSIDACKVKLIPKGDAAPTGSADFDTSIFTIPTLSFSVYRSDIGPVGPKGSGEGLGAGGVALHDLSANLGSHTLSGTLRYSVYTGLWREWVSDDASACPVDPNGAIQAIKFELTDELAKHYDIWYHVYAHNIGWMTLAKNGAPAGVEGMERPVEAVQVWLMPKGAEPQGAAEAAFSQAFLKPTDLSFFVHMNGQGEQGPTTSGNGLGTSGVSLHDVRISLSGDDRAQGSINYQVNTGNWQGWVSNGASACPVNDKAPVQALRVSLDGNVAQLYDVWYRVFVHDLGWLDCASNGEAAGSLGLGLPAEAIQLWLTPKGAGAPLATGTPLRDLSNTSKIGWQNPQGYYQVSARNVAPRPNAYWPFNYVTPSRIAVNASRQDCINAFLQRAGEYVGTPYVWNYSCAPGVGVDCIGLVYQCAYATGMDLGEFNPWDHWATGASGWHSHDAVNMWNYGNIQRLSINARQPGDLIFWPGHVGIYLGGDRMIHAYTPSTGVFVSSIWGYGTILGVGRLYVA